MNIHVQTLKEIFTSEFSFITILLCSIFFVLFNAILVICNVVNQNPIQKHNRLSNVIKLNKNYSPHNVWI